jgi:hypothetical protein
VKYPLLIFGTFIFLLGCDSIKDKHVKALQKAMEANDKALDIMKSRDKVTEADFQLKMAKVRSGLTDTAMDAITKQSIKTDDSLIAIDKKESYYWQNKADSLEKLIK